MKLLVSSWRIGLIVVLVAASLFSAPEKRTPYSTHERAFFTAEAVVNFVRPGLVFKITAAQIAADGTITAIVCSAQMVSALWHHGPQMQEQMKSKSIAWPRFSGKEMADLIGYLSSSGKGK